MICICVSHPHLLCPEAVNNHRPKGPHHPNALFNTPRGLWCVCACINVPQNHLRVCCLVLCFHVFMTRRTGFAFAKWKCEGIQACVNILSMRVSECASGVSHSLLVFVFCLYLCSSKAVSLRITQTEKCSKQCLTFGGTYWLRPFITGSKVSK